MKKSPVMGCILFFISSAAIYAQAIFPDTPAGQRAREVSVLMNKGDAEAGEEFVENNYSDDFKNAFPMQQHIGLFTTTKQRFGELELYRIETASDYSIAFILKSRTSDKGLRILIDLESSVPHKITRMGVRPAGISSMQPSPRVKTEEGETSRAHGNVQDSPFSNWKEMDAHLVKQTGENKFSGVVLVAKEGIPLFKKAYGLASKTYQVPNRIDTKFNLASLGKWFTEVAITQLAEAGKIHFDDPIGMYLKDFKGEAAEKVTVRHLLQMRSGWGDYWQNETYQNNRNNLRTVSDYIAFLKDLPLNFEPGTQMVHSNTSFIVLGAVVEAVSGQDFDTYVREHILKPAGMVNTYPCASRDEPIKNVAAGYTNHNPFDPDKTGYRWSNIYFIAASGTPAGGGYSTAEDFLAFDTALRNHRLLDEKYTNFIHNRYQGSVDDAVSIPSFLVRTAGGAAGSNTFYGLDFTQGYTIIIFSNYDIPVAVDLSREIIRMLGLS